MPVQRRNTSNVMPNALPRFGLRTPALRAIKTIGLHFLLLAMLITPASAQSAERLVISFVDTEQQGQATLLRVLYSMTGSLARRDVDLAEIVLDGTPIDTDTNPSDSPFYIALTLDFSGSMRNSVIDMRDAAIRAVNNAPANAQITIIRFNATVNATPFLTREEAIADLQTIVRGDAEGGTKLYDATYTAIEDVQRIAGGTQAQRAVILFTDGNDVENIGDTQQFSERSFRDVIDLAQRPGLEVPIYTIGLGGNVDPNLPTMSTETGAQHLSESTGASLGNAFVEIMTSLGRPWLAEALVCTTAGVKDAILRVTTVDNDVLEAPIQFTVAQDCVTTAPSVAIARVEPFQAENRYEVEIVPENAERVVQWVVGIFSAESEQTTIQQDATATTFNLDATNLTEGAEYTVRVTGLDADGAQVANIEDSVILAEQPFTHWTTAPAIEPLRLRLRDIFIEDDGSFLNGRFTAENDQFVRRYQWQLKDVNAVAPIPLDNDKFVFNEADGTFRYTLDEVELVETQYELWVDAFDADGNLLDGTRSTLFQYTPPPPTMPLWQKILIALLILLLLALLAYLLWLLYKRRKKEEPAPTPIRKTMLGVEEEFIPPPAFDPNPTTSIRVNQSPGWPEPYQILYINRWPFTIGRENCDLSLEGDWRVSRNHCQIDYREGAFYIEDFGSSNGTVVNGQPVEPGVQVPLYAQSIIELGRDTVLEFEP